MVSAAFRRQAVATFAFCTMALLMVLPEWVAVSAQVATPAASPISTATSGPLPPPWLEFGPDGTLIARVIVDTDCPPIVLDGFDVVMTSRSTPSDTFPVVACEAPIPFGTQSATILNKDLPLPKGRAERIAIIGDTGCRLNDWEKKFQACNNPDAWPFAQVALSVAEWQTDLIVHVGDYLYRESPCPAEMAGCNGSPHGDNWATWNADFFTPASPLLGAAPWIFMRGNHETCDRNPEGWFAYLDTRPFQAMCQKFTEPYIAPVLGLSFAVIDSAEASDEKVTPDEQAEYARQFDLLSRISPPGSWLVTHRPVWGILANKAGEFQVDNAAYEAATGDSLTPDFALILSGHIHVAESISFDESSKRAPQLISGNSGTALDDVPTASPTAGQLGDPDVTEAETLSAFGFLTLEPEGENWAAVQRDRNGNPVISCILDLPEMSCEPVG